MVKKPKILKTDTEPTLDAIEEVDTSFYQGKAGDYYIDEHGRHVRVPTVIKEIVNDPTNT